MLAKKDNIRPAFGPFVDLIPYPKSLPRTDCLVCPGAFLHCCFEAYFVRNHATIAGSQELFAQIWKEYAKSDFRYVTSDPFMVCVELLTGVSFSLRLPSPLSVTAVTADLCKI